jgi:phosphoribosyl 1,2-cyclic phosphodiesterase
MKVDPKSISVKNNSRSRKKSRTFDQKKGFLEKVSGKSLGRSSKEHQKGVETKKKPKKNVKMEIRIWGARGSLPSPVTPVSIQKQIHDLLDEFVQWSRKVKGKGNPERFLNERPRHKLGGYGGNTLCVEINAGNQQLIIDAGSGIRLLGYDLMNGPSGQGKAELHILFTHFHWDHLIGLPFFTPIFIPGNVIHVYSVQPELKNVFQSLFKKPYFPVDLASLGAKIEYHTLEPRKPRMFGDIKVTPYQLDHPDPCWGYKVERGGKVYSHCVDTECKRTMREELGPDLPLYQNVDLMVFDAQYTIMESIEKVNWGHAAATIGLDLAMREGIKQVVFMHHDPASSNEKIAAAESQARRYYEAQLKNARERNVLLHEVDWKYGFEGMLLEL